MTVFRSIHFLQPLLTLGCLCTVSTISSPDLPFEEKPGPFSATILGPVAQPALCCCCLYEHIPTFLSSLNASFLLLDLTKCAPAAGPLYMEPSWPERLLLLWWCHTLPHPQVSSSITGHRFPQTIEPYYQSNLLSPPLTSLCLLSLLHLPPECFSLWGHCLSLPLRWWRTAGERELCCVLLHSKD